jgi:hypothetical protein
MEKKLINAVKRQIGEVDNLEDVYNHGADAGFPGFTYYSDTVEFYKKNKAAIIELAKEHADGMGINILEMIGGFNCLKYYDYNTNRWTDAEGQEAIGQTVYGRKVDDVVANALAWFALEEVAREIYDK